MLVENLAAICLLSDSYQMLEDMIFMIFMDVFPKYAWPSYAFVSISQSHISERMLLYKML